MNNKILYFAYGSNMSSKNLSEWCKRKNLKIIFKNPRVARLAGYEIKFTLFSELRNGGVADVVKSNSEVFGVLFETDEESIKNLDKKEIGYKKIKVAIVDVNDNLIEDVMTYEVIKKSDYKPGKQYLKIILGGAKEHNLPKWYIEKMSNVQTNN